MDKCRICGHLISPHEQSCGRCHSNNPNYSTYYNSPISRVDAIPVEIDIRNCNCHPAGGTTDEYIITDIKHNIHKISYDTYTAICRASSNGQRTFRFVKYEESYRNYPVPVPEYLTKQENKLNKKLLLI